MLGCFFKQCAANVVMDRWTRKCSAWQNARRHFTARAEKSARLASRITICGTYLQRGALNPAWIFRPFRARDDHSKIGGANRQCAARSQHWSVDGLLAKRALILPPV